MGTNGDADVPIALIECANGFEIDVTIAKLRSEGIEASGAASTARGGLALPAGNFI